MGARRSGKIGTVGRGRSHSTSGTGRVEVGVLRAVGRATLIVEAVEEDLLTMMVEEGVVG